MSWWSSLFHTDDATWQSQVPPLDAVAAIARTFPRLAYRVTTSGSSLSVVPRSGRGRPVYAIQVDASSIAGGSRIESHVQPATTGVARTALGCAVVTCVGLLLLLANVRVSAPFFLNPAFIAFFAGFGTVVFSAQLLLMGNVRKGASRRLASKMYSAGVTALPPPGWYPDPSDSTIQRWWNGNAWTEKTSL